MSVISLGLNHQSAPLALRERFAFSTAQLPLALQSLRERLSRLAPEITLLSTCNRTELYIAAEAASEASELATGTLDWLAQQGGIDASTLATHAYINEDRLAARHAFRVAAGLDSMVLGEPQILGQMKVAVREAGQAGTLGRTLHQLFQRSFSVAKEVRTGTEIGSHSVSMAAAAARLAVQLFGDLGDSRVLLIGAGEMVEHTAAHFASRKPRSMTVANRTVARGEALAERFHASSMPLVELGDRLHEFDVVISCTASSVPILGLGAVERALKQRRRRPLFMVDLAVPRDIEPEVARLPDVYLYTVDDLASLVRTAGDKRQAEVARAEAIVDAGVRDFESWLSQRASVPLIRAIQDQADVWRQAELARARRQLARGAAIDEVFEALTRGLTAKLMHGALAELRAADAGHRERVEQTLSRCFLPKSLRQDGSS